MKRCTDFSRAAGTFGYMAPEQAIGYAQPSSDIYRLARLLIEMLTGTPLSELLPNAALDLPKKVWTLLANLDVGLSEESLGLLSAALEFDPMRRPSDVKTFGHAWSAILRHGARRARFNHLNPFSQRNRTCFGVIPVSTAISSRLKPLK